MNTPNTSNNMVTITIDKSELDEFINNKAVDVKIVNFEWSEHSNRPSFDYTIDVNEDWTMTIDASEYEMVSVKTFNELEQKWFELNQTYDEIETLNDKLVGVNEGLQNEIDQLKKELADLKSKKKPFWVVW